MNVVFHCLHLYFMKTFVKVTFFNIINELHAFNYSWYISKKFMDKMNHVSLK